ncbi:MAG TPA: hypothetical protein VGL84_00605, partial [Gaiellaceae bacterium]
MIVGVLVLVSLVLITVSFRSSALDGVQGTAASALKPFEIAANRVARPFRDAISWTNGLIGAKSDNVKLRREIATLKQAQINDEQAIQENVQLQQQLRFKGPPSIADFDRVSTEVTTNPQNSIEQTVTIAAGSSSGVGANDVVLAPS